MKSRKPEEYENVPSAERVARKTADFDHVCEISESGTSMLRDLKYFGILVCYKIYGGSYRCETQYSANKMKQFLYCYGLIIELFQNSVLALLFTSTRFVRAHKKQVE